MKAYQVKIAILDCTGVCLKGLKTLTAHRKYVRISNMYGTQIVRF